MYPSSQQQQEDQNAFKVPAPRHIGVNAQSNLFSGATLDSNNESMVASQESSLTAQGLITYNKTILVRPEELTFSQVTVNQALSQVVTMQNTLSAPVEIILKSSSQERLDISPKNLRLQPHEACQVTVTFRQPRPFPAKTLRQKETIFIKSDFFDQKVAVIILPATATSATASEASSSLQRLPSGGRNAAFQQTTMSMSRQQLATTTLGKTQGAFKSPTQEQRKAIGAFEDLGGMGGQNDSFGRVTASDFEPAQDSGSSGQVLQRRQEFDPSVQASTHVEVTLAADCKADIVSAVDLGTNNQRQFESHETNLLKQQLNELRVQNQQLREELADAQRVNGGSEIDHIEQIKALLREREPKLEELLEESIKVERAGQKRKDAKVLEILQFKDKNITELTQALADHKVVKQVMQDQTSKLLATEQSLQEVQERLRQYEGGEDRFQELLLSQNRINEQTRSINDLQTELASMKNEVGTSRQTKVFFEESLERAKTQATLLQGQLNACEVDLGEERDRNENLEAQIGNLQAQLGKLMAQQHTDMGEQALNLEHENTRLKERVFRMEDQLQQVFKTLGKVTGDGQNSHSKASTVEQNEEEREDPLAHSSGGFDEKLQQRAEEIVLIVEQVQMQYMILEKEMRSLVDKGPARSVLIQTDLSRADIDDIYGHYEQMREQLVKAQSSDDAENQLSDAQRTIERLEDELRTFKSGDTTKVLQQQAWRLLDGAVSSNSNENLLTNRNSSSNQDQREMVTAPANVTHEILVSERGGQTQRNRLALSSINHSNNNAAQHQRSDGLNLNTSNTVVREMQERENQLLDQLSVLKEQMRFQTSHSDVQTVGGANDPSTFANEHLQLRMAELETLVFQQREHILELQDHNAGLKHQLDEKIEENRTKMELYELRNHNLQELNRKYQGASKAVTPGYNSGNSTAYVNTYATTTQGNEVQSPPIALDRLHTDTGGDNRREVERVKQYAQEQEMKVMDLSHSLKEAQVQLKHAHQTKTEMIAKLAKTDQHLARLGQDQLLAKAGVNVNDSKLAMLVNELKAKIKKLQAESQKQLQAQTFTANSTANTVNQQLQGQNSSLYALREEYCTKLEKLVEANTQERSDLHSQSLSLQQKTEATTAQLKAFEDKEMRLFSQLEEIRSQKSLEEDHLQKRIGDQSSMLDQKQQVCGDLEREISQKDKMLSERQEQLSILLSAMESQSQADGVTPLGQAQQKLATMAAELCSLKAVEAQMERRCAEIAHKETQASSSIQKLENQLADAQVKVAMLSRKVETMESSNELLERQKQDLGNRVEEVDREKSDHQYKLERLQFQLKTKEETVECLKTQSQNAERHFKEQVDRIREDLLMRQPKVSSYPTLGRNRDGKSMTLTSGGRNDTIASNTNECHMLEHRPRHEVALKIAIQQLHLVIADYIERSGGETGQMDTVEGAQKNIISEMELALNVAQTTIQRLEGDLDRERSKTAQLSNEWDALALNGILVTRQERMTAQLKTVGRLLADREMQSTNAHRMQLDQLNRVLRQQEQKNENDVQVVTQLDSEVQGLKLANKRLLAENEDLQATSLCYAQEQQALYNNLEKKAQISVDERHRQRIESVKVYFEQSVAKMLLQTGTADEQLKGMGREIGAHQLLADKHRRQIEQLVAERDGLDSTVRFLKAAKEDNEAKLRDQVSRAATDQAKLEAFESGANTNVALSRRKQECLTLEKDLIKGREAFEMKSREVTTLLQRIESQKFDNMQKQVGSDLDILAKRKTDGAFDEAAQQKIQSLQEQLMEIRGGHIQELEELKVQCDVDVAETRRELSQQQRQFESKFMPGKAPGEILDQNHELRERVTKLQIEVDHLCQDTDAMRAQLFERDQQLELLSADLQDRDHAINELEQVSSVPVHLQQPLKSALKKKVQLAATSDNAEGNNTAALPSAIIQQLFSAKRAELYAKQKLRAQLQIEVKLRMQVSGQLQDELQAQYGDNSQNTFVVIGEEVVNQLMAQNANILSILQDGAGSLNTLGEYQPANDDENGAVTKNQSAGDYEVLLKALIYFSNQQALKSVQLDLNQQDYGLLQRAPLNAVIEAQRIVIRALSQRHSADRIRYGPEGEIDRKVWYLELLEEQVSNCESQTTKLQDFVKRLQIGVSGSLHSAAEIKASSMDLAQHLKMASDEVKTLRNVTGLIKHDVLNLQQAVDEQQQTRDVHNMSVATINDGAFNPFLTGALKHTASMKTLTDAGIGGELQTAHLQQTHRKNMESILNEHESVQNQLNLTSKIKQSLETELVHSKLAHVSEMQQVIQKMSNAEKRLQEASLARSQMANDKKQTDDLVVRQDEELASIKAKFIEMEQSMQGAKLDAAKAASSSKQWQKMQSDMQDWRRSHEESIRAKQKQVTEAQDKVKQMKAEKKRTKAEVQMLRQNQREQRDGSSVDKLKQENELLVQRFNEQLDERKKEIEFWVQERAQMRDKIDELESGAIGQMNMFNVNEAAVESGDSVKRDRLSKKVKAQDLELKQLKSELLEKKNLLSKGELKLVKLDAKLREAMTGLADSENKVTLLTNRTKELDIEKEMLMQRQKDRIRSQDQGTDQINTELDKMREEFARVRVQRDELEIETQRASEREKQWRDNIDKLNRNVNSLQNNLTHKESESTELRSLTEKKMAALLSDLKFMRDENQKLHVKLKEANECCLLLEQQVAQVSQERSEQEVAQDSLKRKLNDHGETERAKDLSIAEAQAQLQAVESAHYHRTKQLQKGLAEIKTESQQTCQLLQAQIEQLKARLLSEKKASSKEIEQSLALTQKEASLKHSKKELNIAKTQITTLKGKVKELKQQLDEIPQRPVPQSKTSGGPPRRIKANTTQAVVEPAVETIDSAFRRKLADIDGLDKLLKATNKVADLETQITEGQLELSKVENWNYALSQQLEDAKIMLESAEDKINDLNREKKELGKAGKQFQSQNEKQLKENVKSLVVEVEKIRQEWSSPQAVAQQQDQVVQLTAQVKSLQAEISRKSKHLGQVKQQKEQTSKEQSQVQVELTQLKEDNTRLRAQVREGQKADKQSRDLRSQIDWVTKSEKRLKEEILSLNEKLKQTRAELSRKDQHLRDYKDRMDMIQSEVTGKSDLEGELGKLRDLNRRQRLDLEVKENQVRTLRTRIEQNHVEIQALSEEKVTLAQQDNQLGVKLKDQKQKAKRYEVNLEKSVTALKKIGVELAALHQHQRQDSKQSAATFGGNGESDRNQPIPVYKRNDAGSRPRDNPMAVDDLDKEAEYFKQGVEILGLSMNEMESFINPQVNAAATIQASNSHNIADSPTSLVSSRGQYIARTTANAGLLERLERLDERQVDQRKIEEIGDYCVQMLSEMANN